MVHDTLRPFTASSQTRSNSGMRARARRPGSRPSYTSAFEPPAMAMTAAPASAACCMRATVHGGVYSSERPADERVAVLDVDVERAGPVRLLDDGAHERAPGRSGRRRARPGPAA